ncbi:hypothetical protein K457DRAFT_26027 [Linnemannia elongata AG-77]|uniref:Uncharacterized protein n=1 Tax=Linnemannia elongata AG-77 TaxID=1314771 RepID=A0A197JBK1_9FUNG|nr:hypothetical protein K457DRAFT_26027 [Linnemannia elongata AG-77]
MSGRGRGKTSSSRGRTAAHQGGSQQASQHSSDPEDELMSSQDTSGAKGQKSISASTKAKKRKPDEDDDARDEDEQKPAGSGVTKAKGKATVDLYHAIRSSEGDTIASMKHWANNYSKSALPALTHLTNLVLGLCGLDKVPTLKANMISQEAHIDFSNQGLSQMRLKDLPGEENYDANKYTDLLQMVDSAIRTWAETCKEKWLMDPSLAGKEQKKTATPPAPLMIQLCTSLIQKNMSRGVSMMALSLGCSFISHTLKQLATSSTNKIAALDKYVVAFQDAVRASPLYDDHDWQTTFTSALSSWCSLSPVTFVCASRLTCLETMIKSQWRNIRLEVLKCLQRVLAIVGENEEMDLCLKSAMHSLICLAASEPDLPVRSIALDTLLQVLPKLALEEQDQQRLFLLSLMPLDDAVSDSSEISKSVASMLQAMFERYAEDKKSKLEQLTDMSNSGRHILGLIWGVIRMITVVRKAFNETELEYFTSADVSRCRTAIKLLFMVEKKLKDEELLLRMFLNFALDNKEKVVLSVFLQHSYHNFWSAIGTEDDAKRVSKQARFAASRMDALNACGTNTIVTNVFFGIMKDLPPVLLVSSDPKNFGEFVDACIAQLRRAYTGSCAEAVAKAFATWGTAMYSVVGPHKPPSPIQQDINIAHAYNTLCSKIQGLVKIEQTRFLKLGQEVCETTDYKNKAVQLVNVVGSLAAIIDNVAASDQGLSYEEYINVFLMAVNVSNKVQVETTNLVDIAPCCFALMQATMRADITLRPQNYNSWRVEIFKHLNPIVTSNSMPADVVLDGLRTFIDASLIPAKTSFTTNGPNNNLQPFNDSMVNFIAEQVKTAVVNLMSIVTKRAGTIEKAMKEDEDSTGRDFYLEAAEFQIYQECAGGSAAHLIYSIISGVQAYLIGLKPAVIIMAHLMAFQHHFQQPLSDLMNSVHLHTFNNTLSTIEGAAALKDLLELASASLPQSFESEVKGGRSHKGTKRLAAMWSKALKENAFNPLTASGYTDEDLSFLYTTLIKVALYKILGEKDDLFWDALKIIPLPKKPSRELCGCVDRLRNLDSNASSGSAEYVAFFDQSTDKEGNHPSLSRKDPPSGALSRKAAEKASVKTVKAEDQAIHDELDKCDSLILKLQEELGKYDPDRKHDAGKRTEVIDDIEFLNEKKKELTQELSRHLQREVKGLNIHGEDTDMGSSSSW